MESIDVVERLKEKQAELGIETQTELAELLGVNKATISRVYSGKRGPGSVVIMAMLRLWPDVFSGDGETSGKGRDLESVDESGPAPGPFGGDGHD